MSIKFYIGLTAFRVPEEWFDGKWKVFFYYRKWPVSHNDNDMRYQ